MQFECMMAKLGCLDTVQLLSAVALPFLVIGPDGIIAYANDASESLLGRSKRRIEGAHISDILLFTDKRINSALASDESDVSAQDMEMQCSSGRTIVDFTLTPISGQIGWRSIMISPRNGTRAHISDFNQTGMQQALGATAILGHEIKNPLAGIKGAAQLLARQVDKTGGSLTELIINEVDRIARLLDQMQNLGSASPGNIAPANIHLLIERAIRSIRAANKALPEIEISYDPSLPDVIIDADAMVQILINLIQNAVDATDNKTESMIGITTRFVLSGALRDIAGERSRTKLPVEVTIWDNGAGVPVRIEDAFFAPFVTTKRDGQGLGLAIVRKLIGNMNSRIIYERDPVKKITNFKMFLPIAGKETLR
jgi:two-component system, NtrC family, nitrogen regulation sensor histidine kinase GlnL